MGETAQTGSNPSNMASVHAPGEPEVGMSWHDLARGLGLDGSDLGDPQQGGQVVNILPAWAVEERSKGLGHVEVGLCQGSGTGRG